MPCIGEIWDTTTIYYDAKLSKQSIKKRPVLVIAQADSGDFIVLPISKISRQENIHPKYDIPVDPVQYPLLNLKKDYCSYIRTHKQIISHTAQFSKQICGSVKVSYEELYLEILTRREEFSEEITRQALQ